jgi:hypothetical protein
MRGFNRSREDSGQALIETVLLMCFVLLPIILNAVNFGYFFLMALNLSASTRSGGLYSITGGATPSAIALPPAGATGNTKSVSYLTYQDLTGAVYSPTTQGGVQVCSPSVGTLNPGTATQQSKCTSFGSGSFPAADVDPELDSSNAMPAFMLNRVDVAYQFSPPIPATPFNALLLLSSACSSSGGVVTCTFYRHAEMRAMN